MDYSIYKRDLEESLLRKLFCILRYMQTLPSAKVNQNVARNSVNEMSSPSFITANSFSIKKKEEA